MPGLSNTSDYLPLKAAAQGWLRSKVIISRVVMLRTSDHYPTVGSSPSTIKIGTTLSLNVVLGSKSVIIHLWALPL